MKYIGTLIAVNDMEASKRFYQDVLGLAVVNDFGANVVLTGGVCLQTLDTWKGFIHSDKSIIFQNHAVELYFEEEDMDAFIQQLQTFDKIHYVHPLKEHRWGQRVIRFYDLDSHIIEVGEAIKSVVKRFMDSGLTISQTAERMDVPISFVECHLV